MPLHIPFSSLSAIDSGKRGTLDGGVEYRRQVRALLAQLRAIVQRTYPSASSVADFAAHLTGRLDVLARVQEILMRSADTQVDLAELVADEFLGQGIGDRLDAPSPSLLVDREVAAPLALALHELATNAIKFGQLHDPGRRILVRWRQDAALAGLAALEWREQALNADAPPAGPDGFGFELIRGMLPYELGASTSIELGGDGMVCTILFRRGSPPAMEPHRG